MRIKLVLGAVFFFFLSGSVLAADGVKIVHIDPFSGPFQELGDRHFMATQFVVDEINAQGGLLGKKVELIKADSELKPDVSARKALRAVLQDGANVIMQNISTAVAKAIMNVAEEHNVLQVSHATYSDELQARILSKFLSHLLHDEPICKSFCQLLCDQTLSEILRYQHGLCLRTCRGR